MADVVGFIEKILSDDTANQGFYKSLIKALRQTNYDTKIQDKEIDFIKQLYSPAGLAIQERVSPASGATPIIGAKLPPEAIKGWRRPLASGPVTSEMRWRNGRPHEGIDLGVPIGTPVFAAKDGKIQTVAPEGTGGWGGYGNIIVISHGDGITTRYAHLSKFIRGLVPGTPVTAGQQIAFSGNTNGSAGGGDPHLHFEIRINGTPQNPRNFVTF